MAEPLRTFALSCVQQAQVRVYEGRPFEPWNNPYRHSLPPATDKRKKIAKPKISNKRMADRPNMALVSTPEGRRRWSVMPEIAAETERRIVAGERPYRIAKALGLSTNMVQRLAKDLHQQPVEATPANPKRQQSVMVALPGALPVPATACTSIAQAARFTFEVQTLPVRITRTVRISTEPRSRTHVLDWQHRMAAYAFDGEPGKGKPKGSRSSAKGCTHHQINGVMRSNHEPTVAARINPVRAPALVHSQTIAPACISPFD